MSKTIDSVLSELRAGSSSNRELGDRFERLMRGYLMTDPLYAERFESVWLWQDWPGREGAPDTGVDLVGVEKDGGVCAIQCKFYDPSHRLEKSDIDSFFTASGKSPFTSRLIISTTDHWSVHAEKALDKQQIPVTRLRVRDLAASPVDWDGFSPAAPSEIRLRESKRLRPHQEEALAAVLHGLQEADRGKLIMACGTGKTLTSLRIAETFAGKENRPESTNVLFLVPSISLLSQTVREWTAETDVEMRAFAVCSDTKVGRHSEDISRHDLAFNATTDPRKLLDQVRATGPANDGHGQRLSVIFSTYQSLAVIHEAQKLGMPSFDLVICDEAHRTTGATLAGEDESHFVRIHDGNYIGARKRLT
jgi:predicted helicase